MPRNPQIGRQFPSCRLSFALPAALTCKTIEHHAKPVLLVLDLVVPHLKQATYDLMHDHV